MSEEKRTDPGESPQREILTLDRGPREERETRPSDAWVPAATLPVPTPQDGYVFRWVRTSTFDNVDNKNVSQKFREGWEPVRAEDHRELKVQSDLNSQFKGNIEIGGLLLCKAPIELVKKRRAYYEQLAQGQMKAVDQGFMQENDPRVPKFIDRKSRTTQFGEG